jgi:hypothetical protein
MDIKLNLPFSIEGASKKTFKILKEEDLNKLSEKKGKGILNFLKKVINKKINKENQEQNREKNKNSILYTKASTTKKYYQKINKK